MRRLLLYCAVLLIFIASSARALTPQELALVINKNVPDGRALAETYAKARGVPDGRIIELALPVGDDLPFDQYETVVVPQVREFLAKNHLLQTVRCLVTFYGMPLRIAPRQNTPQDNSEIEQIRLEMQKLTVQMEKIAAQLEEQAKQLDPSFKPIAGRDLTGVLRRVEVVRQFIGQHVNELKDPAARNAYVAKINQIAQQLVVPATTQPSTRSAQQTMEEMAQLEQRRFDPAARARIREIAQAVTGPLPYAKLLDTQLGYLMTDDSQAAFDSELALLYWPMYARVRWQPNPMHFHLTERTPPVLMVSRLDAQTPDTVRQMIQTSIEVEQHGIEGVALIDTWAKDSKRPDGSDDDYTKYDKAMLSLGNLIRDKTKIPVTIDTKPELVPQGSVKNIALYCGWYSPNEFVSPGTFARGAVAVHIASYTLTALHQPSSGDWVRQLLNSGAVATFGAVSEPYLHAFPKPDELFALILTGKMTLAEAYWRTTPLVSWRLALVGDPLYTPFKQDPALAVADLPRPLQSLFSDATTQHSTTQGTATDGR